MWIWKKDKIALRKITTTTAHKSRENKNRTKKVEIWKIKIRKKIEDLEEKGRSVHMCIYII